MTIDRTLLAFIGRRFPVAWDLIPRGAELVALNPQPLPPIELVALNTQPIPPGEVTRLNPQPLPPRALGAVVATELLHLGWLAERLGTDLVLTADLEDDWCPTYPRAPHLPPHLDPVPDPEPHPDWLLDYHLGLAGTLAAAPEYLAGTALAAAALDRSSIALEAALGRVAVG